MSAEKKLRENLDIVEELVEDGYEVHIRRIGAKKASKGGVKIRVAMGQPGDWWSTGEGTTFPVALQRALKNFRDYYYEEYEIEDPDDSLDPIVALLELV